MDVTKQFKRGGGRGGRGSRGSRSRGRGRGSRGRGAAAPNKSFQEVVDLDEEDELCNQALAQAELENNSIARAFDELNSASSLEGFDPMSGGIWIYPTNRPVRDYQFKIVQTALFNNTLVSLPTGLGKTFISAVVMYNFQRWYPNGIIVFMAPTRPLVTQQLDACHNTVGISPSKTVELTGNIAPKKREQLWQSKRVFFLTPQVMVSDMERNFFQPEHIRCIVVDEAHKALGNHAYVQVITKVAEKNKLFRLLALSATPGSDLIAVQQVFKNLLISRVELRSENSEDILPYIHERKVDKFVVKLDGNLKNVYDKMIEIYQTYSGSLMKDNILTGRSSTSYTKFQLLKAREQFRETVGPRMTNQQRGRVEVDFAVCISLAHAVEILLSHGLRTFFTFIYGVINKERGTAAASAELARNVSLQELLNDIQEKFKIDDLTLESSVDLSKTEDHNYSNISFDRDEIDFSLSHPKLKILKDIVHKHFFDHQTTNNTTRVMIFSQYRDSVQEIGKMLNTLRPLVKPTVFIGQANTSTVAKGLKQKDQVQVVQQFRDGVYNVLVCTCVGEEGLDIGEVDLIVCFDTSKSPIRLIQRMGRTGRKRDGRTVFLLTEGKEERSYGASFSLHTNINKCITDPKKLEPYLYKQSPRMVPAGLEPVCYKMTILLTSELSAQSSVAPLLCESSDDENAENSDPVKERKPVNKKKLDSKKKDTNSAKLKGSKTSNKIPSQTISSMFERMQQVNPKKQTDIHSKTAAPVPAIVELDEDDDIYYIDDDFHDVAHVNQHKACNEWSIHRSIFDTDKSERKEWQPCTTFTKSKFPSAAAVTSENLNLENLILDFKELKSIEHSLKSRDSFVYLKQDFCTCGNTIESHDFTLAPKSYQTSPKTYNYPLESDFNSPPGPPFESVPAIPLNLTPKTPEGDSDSSDESKDEFSLSPEVGPNRYVARLMEIKRNRCNQNVLVEPTVEMEQTVSQNFPPSQTTFASTFGIGIDNAESKKKFKFKKKADESQVGNQPGNKSQNASSIFQQSFRPPSPVLLGDTGSDSVNSLNTCNVSVAPSTKITKESFSKKQPSQDPGPFKIPFLLQNTKSPSLKKSALSPRHSVEKRTSRMLTAEIADSPTSSFSMHYKGRQSRRVSQLNKESNPTRSSFGMDTSSPKAGVSRKSSETWTSPLLSPIANKPASKFKFKNARIMSPNYNEESPVNCTSPQPRIFGRPRSLSADLESSLEEFHNCNPTLNTFVGSGEREKKCPPRSGTTKTQPSAGASISVSTTRRKNISSESDNSSTPSIEEINACLMNVGNITEPSQKYPYEVQNTSNRSSVFQRSFRPPSPVLLGGADSSSDSDSPFVKPKSEKPRNRAPKQRKKNPFIDEEAGDSGGDSELGEEHEYEDLDKYDDSFVASEDDGADVVTASQQVRYIESVKDTIPARFGRIEKPLTPKHYGTRLDTSEDGYDEEDSFCQGDGQIEYADVGVFTQAMNQAKFDLAVAASSGSNPSGRQTRRAKREANFEEDTDTGSAPLPGKNKQKQRRRRVFTMDDSSDEDEDFK